MRSLKKRMAKAKTPSIKTLKLAYPKPVKMGEKEYAKIIASIFRKIRVAALKKKDADQLKHERKKNDRKMKKSRSRP